MVRAIFLSILGPIVLSLIGPIYFGLTNLPYAITIVWALGCTLWWAQQSIKVGLTDRNWLQPAWYKATVVGAVVGIFAFVFVSAGSLGYFLAEHYQSQVLALKLPLLPTTASVQADHQSR